MGLNKSVNGMQQQFNVSAVRLVSPDKGNKGRPVFVEEDNEKKFEIVK
jgi:hypothetical protein